MCAPLQGQSKSWPVFWGVDVEATTTAFRAVRGRSYTR